MPVLSQRNFLSIPADNLAPDIVKYYRSCSWTYVIAYKFKMKFIVYFVMFSCPLTKTWEHDYEQTTLSPSFTCCLSKMLGTVSNLNGLKLSLLVTSQFLYTRYFTSCSHFINCFWYFRSSYAQIDNIKELEWSKYKPFNVIS